MKCYLFTVPYEEGAVSKMMQSIGRMYVRYYNDTYQRSGTLWEGRFKSSLIQSEKYLLELHRYIELNPVRADMVDEPSDYSWSSYACNALGIETALQTPHPLYLALGKTKRERLESYRELFKGCSYSMMYKLTSHTILAYFPPELLPSVRSLQGSQA